MIRRFRDIHTHGAPSSDAVVNLRPGGSVVEGGYFSAGIHPWDTPCGEEAFKWLESIACESHVVAIGECGLDALRGAQLAEQETVFIRQARLAEALEKPLIIHCVRAWHRLLALRPQLPDNVRLIVHGFRGKPALARQLLAAGFDLSFGEHFNSESFSLTPSDRRFLESDEGKYPQI